MLSRVCALSVALGAALLMGLACQHTERPDRDRDAEDAASQLDAGREAGFGVGACYGCLAAACGAPIDACNGEPSCAGYLACVAACPTQRDGKADPACVAGCPPASGSASAAAQAALDRCFAGAAATCVPCGGGAPDAATSDGGFKHPALRQECSRSNERDACFRCQFERCCDSVDAISLGGPATDLADCWLACGDSACEKDCFDRFPAGIPGFGAYDACLGARCIATDDCPTRGTGCGLCSYRECPEELAECLTDVDCFLARECTGRCETADPSCGSSCRASYPNGVVKFDALLVCLGQGCIDVCGG